MDNVILMSGQEPVVTHDADLVMFRGEFIGSNGGADFYSNNVIDSHSEGEISLVTLLDACAKRRIDAHEEPFTFSSSNPQKP